MSKPTPSKTNEVASDRLLIAGLEKHLANASILLNGTSYLGSDLMKRVQARQDAVNATIAARAAWLAMVQAEKEELESSQQLLNSLRRAIFTMFSSIEDLADFGLAPHKKPVLTPAARVAAAAKARATRAARHTMGSRQRKAIVGAIPNPTSPMLPTPAAVAPDNAPIASSSVAALSTRTTTGNGAAGPALIALPNPTTQPVKSAPHVPSDA
jgi:hypothetical protein